MKTLVLAAALCGLATPALAQDWYVSARDGLADPSILGYHASQEALARLGVGYSQNPLRLELSVAHFNSSVALQEWGVTDVGLTGYFDFTISDHVSGFVGAGVDRVRLLHNVLGNFDGNGWHWSVGAAHSFGQHLTGEIQYRALTAEPKGVQLCSLRTGCSDGLSVDDVTIGLRYQF